MKGKVKYSIREKSGALIAGLAGEMTAARMKNADKALAAISGGDSSVVILDFAHVRVVDEAGAGFVVTAFRKASAAGRRIAICRPSAGLRQTLEAYRLDELARIFGSQREALEKA